MPTPSQLPTMVDAAALAAMLPPPESAVVVLDFDGTLSFLVDDPDAAVAGDGADDAVRALTSRTRVLVVSGRPVRDVRSRLAADLDVTFAGGHGSELAHGGGTITSQVDLPTVRARRDAAIAEVAELVGAVDGWGIEPKPTGVAVHHRRAVDPDAHLDAVVAILQSHTAGEMEVTRGHDVLELRPAGIHKGVAVARLLADDDRTPVAFGDDVTDEDTFAEVVERDGVAVLVSARPRPSRARWCLADPDAVIATLAAWATR